MAREKTCYVGKVSRIDGDDVIEDRRRFASCSPMRPTHRAPDGYIDGCVEYPDAHVEDYSILGIIPYPMVRH